MSDFTMSDRPGVSVYTGNSVCYTNCSCDECYADSVGKYALAENT